MRGLFTLAFFFEGQFALLVVVFVLSSTSIFTALECKSVGRSYFFICSLSVSVAFWAAVKD